MAGLHSASDDSIGSSHGLSAGAFYDIFATFSAIALSPACEINRVFDYRVPIGKLHMSATTLPYAGTMSTIRGVGEIALLLGASIVTGWVIISMVPSWNELWSDPCVFAAMGAALTVLMLWASRAVGARGLKLERLNLAVFLAAMPLIYLGRYWLSNAHALFGAWFWYELLGTIVFVGIAWLGMTRRAAWLGVGILAHGIGWDSWHFHHSAYVPDWYSFGCLIADLAIGSYALVRWWGREPLPVPGV